MAKKKEETKLLSLSRVLDKEELDSVKASKNRFDKPYERGGVAPYKINIGDIAYTNWATSEFYKAGDSDNVVTYGPAGPCMILQSSE